MRGLLVFCEGNHDIVFAQRSLGAVAQAEYLNIPIGELPYPLGTVDGQGGKATTSILQQRLASRRLNESTVRAASHAPAPNFESVLLLRSTDTYVMLIRASTDSDAAGATALVSDFVFLIGLVQTSPIKKVGVAFLFDADKAGVTARETQFASNYRAILSGPTPSHGQWVQGTHGPVGLFVFHDPTTRQGTLDVHLATIVQAKWPTRWQAADAYLQSHALPHEPVFRSGPERLKAQMCITGQFVCPGDPMTQVISRDAIPDRVHFQTPESQALATFLTSAPW